ncbi:MAG: NAD(P)-dependent oxidoreductase [Chitinophagaceae bacterium]|nr:NAD(P)-dependent oxidoreductase [Chitinophagaceae bacterium]
MNRQRIGWIGLGNMGFPMARNLLKAGFPLYVYNRTPSKADPLVAEGAVLVPHPKELWGLVDIIITMVSDDTALKDLYGERVGLLACAQAGKIVIDMSTVSPATTRELAGLLSSMGVEYLDAPVSGSVKPAEQGQLVIMVGGKRSVYESVLPIFEKLGKASFLMGSQGAGHTAKLAINLLLAFNIQGLAESVLFARENGIAPKEMLALINESALGNGITRMKTANIENNEFQAAFALKHLTKDLRLAKEQGLRTPGGLALEDCFKKAAHEWGEKDVMAILSYLSAQGEKQSVF